MTRNVDPTPARVRAWVKAHTGPLRPLRLSLRGETPLPEPLTWEAISALDEAALNLAIEQWCYDRAWQRCTHRTCHARHYVRVSMGHDLALDPPQHTTSWDRTMALAWRYRVYLLPRYDAGRTFHWTVYGPIPCPSQEEGLNVETEGGARLAICRLALWRALLEKETP